MRTTFNTGEKPSNTAYGLLALLSIAVFWRTEDVILGLVVGAIGLAALYGHSLGVWVTIAEWARPYLLQMWNELLTRMSGRSAAVEIADPYEICVGRMVDTKQYLYATLEELGSFLVFAITGGGKTSFLHSIVHQLITSQAPGDLKLVIADLKEGLDFRIYQRLPHLALPIATSVKETAIQIDWLLDEMTRRAELYKIIPADRICNNLATFHRLGSEYGLDRLPWIVAIIDEFQNITLQSDGALEGLIKLAKEGRAFGISLIASTQLPKVDDVPTRFKSQFPSWFCGYLASPSHYSKIVEVDKDVYKPFHDGGKIVGRFIANIAGEKMIVSSPYIPERQLEKEARIWSTNRNEPDWPELPETAVSAHARDWSSLSSADRKRGALMEWFAGKGEMPTADEFIDEFGTSLATYYNWVPKLWDEFYSN
jgi:hypothetical protein